MLREALADLARLPDDAWEKSNATPLLVHFRLGSEEPATSNMKEDDAGAEIQEWFEGDQQKLQAEAPSQGRAGQLPCRRAGGASLGRPPWVARGAPWW